MKDFLYMWFIIMSIVVITALAAVSFMLIPTTLSEVRLRKGFLNNSLLRNPVIVEIQDGMLNITMYEAEKGESRRVSRFAIDIEKDREK